MSDRIAVDECRQGRADRHPLRYLRPATSTRFVADFIGDTNLFRGEVIRAGRQVGVCRSIGRCRSSLPLP